MQHNQKYTASFNGASSVAFHPFYGAFDYKIMKRTHGDSNGKNYIYDTWCEIKKRCYNKNYKDYNLWGGRGITIYDPWINNYIAFKVWMFDNLGERPKGYSIDRIDSDGNYVPGNLRWADNFTQMSNRRIQKSNTSGYVGIHFIPNLDKWQARISFMNNRVSIGYFDSKHLACLERNKYILLHRLPHKLQEIRL